MKTWIAITVLTVGLLGSMLFRGVPTTVTSMAPPKPKTLLVAVELGTGARRSIATYPTEEECVGVERSLNVVAEANGRTERSICVVPVDVGPTTLTAAVVDGKFVMKAPDGRLYRVGSEEAEKASRDLGWTVVAQSELQGELH